MMEWFKRALGGRVSDFEMDNTRGLQWDWEEEEEKMMQQRYQLHNL